MSNDLKCKFFVLLLGVFLKEISFIDLEGAISVEEVENWIP